MTRMLRALALLLTLLGAGTSIHAGNLPHVRTGGFDYDEQALLNSTTEATWLAKHHDVIIGAQRHGSDTRFDKMQVTTYDRLKAGNPGVTLLGYIPYQTVMSWMSSWMESYATSQGLNPEDLYCHYQVDTTVRLRNGQYKTIPGYPNGSASTRMASRVVSSWWSGSLPNICPTSSTFRTVYTELVKEAVTIDRAARKYLDGLLLDTFEGSVDETWDLKFENTVELRNLGISTGDPARRRVGDDMVSLRNQLQTAVQTLIGRTAYVMPNGADIDNFYQWYTDVYSSRYSTSYNKFITEYLITPTFSGIGRIQRLKQVYDDLTNTSRPITYFLNSETAKNSGVPQAFTQFILATHYLVNHQNAIFSYHKGSASFYGTESGSFQNTHWHKNIEVDIGTPVSRSGADYWGATGTNRFYVFADGGNSYKLLAREYSKALVLAKFGSSGGWSAIGTNRTTHQLGGSYRQVNADNSLGPVITSITLGWGEGALLMKEGSGGTGNTPPSIPRNAKRSELR